MSYDLRAGLHALSADERATAPELPVGDLRGRARRHRTTRMAVATTTALAIVGAVTVAAVALPGLDAPPQPADSASPTWAPDASGWPAAVTTAGPVPGCGGAIPELVEPAQDPTLTLTAVTQSGPLVGGVPAPVSVTLHGPDGFPLRATSPVVLVALDGVVVGTESPGGSQRGMQYSNDGPSLRWPLVELDLVRCDTKGRGAVPLEPGTYELYVAQDVLRGPAGVATDVTPENRLTVVGGPFTLALGDDARFSGWDAVDRSELPAEVPLISEIVPLAEASSDGSRWHVVAQSYDIDADPYASAVATLVDAGFTVDEEATDAARPTWSRAELSSADFQVTLEVSDSTNWGYHAEYVITALR